MEDSLKCVLQPKIVKNSLKRLILGVQCGSRSCVGTRGKLANSAFMTSSKSVSICNRSHTR